MLIPSPYSKSYYFVIARVYFPVGKLKACASMTFEPITYLTGRNLLHIVRQMLVDHTDGLLTQFVQILIEENHVNLKSIYIDGTKMEAIANCYTFVWRKSVEKYQTKLKERMIKEFVLSTESTLKEVQSKVNFEFRQISNNCTKLKIVFVHGSGKRKKLSLIHQTRES